MNAADSKHHPRNTGRSTVFWDIEPFQTASGTRDRLIWTVWHDGSWISKHLTEADARQALARFLERERA